MAAPSPSIWSPPPGGEYETLKRLEDRLIGSLQPEDLLTLTRKAAEQGLIGSDVKANIESMDSSVPHPLVCRYLFYSVFPKIFHESSEGLKPAGHKYDQWLNLLSGSNSAVRFLEKNVKPCGEPSTYFSEQDISLLTDILAGCSSKWWEIGISLGLPSDELRSIAMFHMSASIRCLNAVLTSWVKLKFPHATLPKLESLEVALRSRTVGLGREASALRETIIECTGAKISEVCLYLYSLQSSIEESQNSSNALEIISQTPKANPAEGKSVLLEVQVRTPSKEDDPFCWWHCGEKQSGGSVMSSFQGVHVFMLCVRACDLTADGAYICTVSLQSGESIGSEPILLVVATPIDAHCKILTNFYTSKPEVPEDTWPPVVGNTYISLALIKQEGIHQTGKYGRCTIRGDMDDIYMDKESTDFLKAFNNLSSAMRVLVEGRPGSGKTTLVHKVSQDWGNGCLKMKYVRLVFLVHLRALSTTPNIDLSTILNCFYSSDSAKCDIVNYAEKHSGLGLCFILDGLDEYSPNSSGDYIVSLIKRQILPNALVIVSSRPAATAKFRSKADIQVEVLGFLKEQIRDYIDLYKFSAESKNAELHKYLHQHPNVHHMCYLPIHVAMVCFLFDIEAQLPSTETDIYRDFTKSSILRILYRCEDDLCLPSLEDLPSLHLGTYMSICKLAYEMTLSLKQVMQQTEVQSFNVKCETDLLGLVTVDRLAMRCGFQKMYTFLHLTFQEFLGAFYVSHLPAGQQMELLEKHGKAEHMQQVWKFYCGLTKLDLGKAFDILFAESSHHSTVYMIQCIVESQNQCLCDFAVKNKTLALSHSYLNHSDFAAAAYVLLNTTVQELSFDDCVFGSEEVATLVDKAGSSISQILTLTFSDCNGTAEQIEVANILAHFLPSLELFDLSSTNLSSNAVFALTVNLSHPTLQVLKVGSRGNDLYRSLELPLDLACTFKVKCKSFRNICFSGSNGVCLPADTQWPLPFCFCCNHPKLVLSCHPLCAMEVKALSHDLKAHFYSHLCLINCDIGGEAIFYLAQGLSCCSGLETLELCCNRVGDTGAINLSNSIKSCLKLGKLDLSCNRIGNEGALAVANSVSSNVKVYFCQNCITKLDEISGMGSRNFDTVDLSSKGLLDSDISLLTATLLLLNNFGELLQLYLQGNSISCNGMTPLSSVLKRCSNLLVLNLSFNNIEANGALILASALAHCTNLLKLDVSSNNLGSDGAKAIARVLTGCTKMLELNISFNSIGCDGTEAIAQALHHCPALHELNISSNNLGFKGAKFLAYAIQGCGNIFSLHANGNYISNEGAVFLAEGLRCCWGLQVLEINSNCIGSVGAEAIANALEHCPFIFALDIGYNNIELKDAVSRCYSLQELDFRYNKAADGNIFPGAFKNLSALNLTNIKLDSDRALSLARGMNCCFNIHEFCVRENSIGDDGAQAISGFLSKCDSLQLLDVAQNSITANGTIALANALRGKRICELDFSRNYIGSQGAFALTCILNSATIRRLRLQSCVIRDEGAIYLALSLKHCSSLLELNISGNNIDSEGAIAECLSECRNLQVLHLNNSPCFGDHCTSINHIGQDGCQALAEKFCGCKNLQVLDISHTAFLGVSFLMNCVQLQELNASSCSSIMPPHEDFINGLEFCINLEKIDMSHNSLPERMIAQFCYSLRNFRLLNELFISHTRVSLDSAEILSDSLYYCKNLEVLDVGFTFRGSSSSAGKFARYLCSKIKHNVKLRSLNIEANFMGRTGAIAVVDGLKHCTKLPELSIGANEIMDEGAIVLAGGLKYWPDLRVLRVGSRCKYVDHGEKESNYKRNDMGSYDFASNYIGSNGFAFLGDALELCPQLRELDVSGNDISRESICHLHCKLHAISEKFTGYGNLIYVCKFIY